MAQKEYKELSCRETGADCDFWVRAETNEEIIRVLSEHACRVHSACEITPDARDRMSSMARTVLCGGEFVDIQGEGLRSPRGEWLED